jgi:hypothetical protein
MPMSKNLLAGLLPAYGPKTQPGQGRGDGRAGGYTSLAGSLSSSPASYEFTLWPIEAAAFFA